MVSWKRQDSGSGNGNALGSPSIQQASDNRFG